MKKFIIFLLLFIISNIARAQNNRILSPSIASLQVMAGDDWRSMPVTTLQGGDPIVISFDELSHEYHRYTYRIDHCEADWSPSEDLFQSDYTEGFMTDNIIDDYEYSDMTYQLYTHYSLQIPNDQCRLTMSGNYRLTVLDNNNGDEPVLEACFMLCENTAGLQLGFTTNTDVDINNQHQQLTMQLSYGSLAVSDPKEQFHAIVMQNQRSDNMVVNPVPQYIMRDGMRWEHCRDLIFPASLECHKFETLSPDHTTMGLASVGWDAENSQWHAYVEPDYPQRTYSYDVDGNGAFLIRNSDNIDNSTTTDYINVHFELHAPFQQGDVYLNGVWTNNSFSDDYRMEWNPEKEQYEKSLLLKQGYYSYRYLLMHSDGTTSNISSEGDFFETENEYQALLYYRAPTDRADRLVAFTTLSTR